MGSKQEPRLGARWAAQVRQVLHRYLPDFHPQAVRGATFSQGAEVVIRYWDGIPEERIDLVIATALFREELEGGTCVRTVRLFSPAYLERVARAYCKGLGYPMPRVVIQAGGSSHVEACILPPDPRRGPFPILLDEEIHRWARHLDAGDIADLAFSYNPSYHLVERNDLERKRDWSRCKYRDFAVISQGGYAKMSRAFDHYEVVRVWERLSPSYVRVHRLTYGGLRGWPHQLHEAMQRLDEAVQEAEKQRLRSEEAPPPRAFPS